MNDPAMEPERRGAIRLAAANSAIIGKPTGKALACSVRNLSSTGARLRIASNSALPDDFVLWIDGEWPRRCHVVWRRDDDVGVAFDESATEPP